MRIYVNRRYVRFTPIYRRHRRYLAHLAAACFVVFTVLWIAFELAGGWGR